MVALVVPQGFLELVLEDDDAAGGGHVGALMAQVSGPGGEPQLVAGVAAVPAGGAVRVDQFRLAEPAQEVLRHADDLRGAAHGVGGVVLIVEHVVGLGHVTSMSRAPARIAPGPRGYGSATPSTDSRVGFCCPHQPCMTVSGAGIAEA